MKLSSIEMEKSWVEQVCGENIRSSVLNTKFDNSFRLLSGYISRKLDMYV